MRWDGRRERWILQARTFWVGLGILSCLIAVGIQVGFQIPEAEGSRLAVLVAILTVLVWMTLKINFTIILSVQIDLSPTTGELGIKSLLNYKEVGDSVRAVELTLPLTDDGGLASLVIDAEAEQYTLYHWLSTDENNRLYECYARRIARSLKVPVRVMREGKPRRTTPVSGLRFRMLIDRLRDDDEKTAPQAAFSGARRRLAEAVSREPAVRLSGDGQSFRLSWIPDRPLGRLLWVVGGALLAAAATAGLRGWAPVLAQPAGFGGLIVAAALWLWSGIYVYFAREELALHEGMLTHKLAGPLGWLFSPLFSPAEAMAMDVEEVWVGGEDPAKTVYIETRFEPIAIQANPLTAEDLAGAISDALLARQALSG